MATMSEVKGKAAVRRAEVYDRYKNGESQAVIAKDIGVTKARVSQMCAMHKKLTQSEPMG